jgi:phage gpG-like protein
MPDLTFGFDNVLQRLATFPDRLAQGMEAGLTDAALIVVKATKENIIKGRPEWPPLKSSTIAHRMSKKSRRQPTPLLDTGTMLRSVHFELEGKGLEAEAAIGWGVQYGLPHEKGAHGAGRSRTVTIPARPHMTPAYEENKDRIRQAIEARLRAALP